MKTVKNIAQSKVSPAVKARSSSSASGKSKTLVRFDWAIKRLFRNKANYVILEGFLSALLKENMKIINITESEGNQTDPENKFNRVDILVEDNRGELIIIEMQNNNQVDYYLRMLFGVSKAITDHISMGDKYDRVRKVYHVNIIYFTMGDGQDYVYHGYTEFRGIHNKRVLQLTAKQKEFFARKRVKNIFPEYYILCVDDFNDVVKDSLDQWIYYLKYTKIPDNFDAPGMAEARKQLKYDKLSEKEKRAYAFHVDQKHYENDVVANSIAEGEAKGRAEGEAKRKELESQIEKKDKELEAERKKNEELAERLALLEQNNGMTK